MQGKIIVSIDSMQLMNSSLENLVKNSPKEKFEWSFQKFIWKPITVSISKKKYINLNIWMTLKNFMRQNYLKNIKLYSLLRVKNVSDADYEKMRRLS